MSWLETKYVQLLGPRFDRFKRKGPVLWNFRCPICGDSEHNLSKARGFIYEKKGELRYSCHNCGYGTKFTTFLKRLDYRLWSEYRLELLKEKKDEPGYAAVIESDDYDVKSSAAILESLPTIEQLSEQHHARLYIQSRRIPLRFFKVFRYAEKFKLFTNRLVPGKFQNLQKDHSYVVQPYFDRNRQFYAFNGRLLEDIETAPRYAAINLSKTKPMIFGLDTVNFNHDIFATEGAFDSCFVENAIAVSGSNFERLTLEIPANRVIIIPDNEPYSLQIKRKIVNCIERGFRIVFWPENISEKDINAMVLGGISENQIMHILTSNVFSGMKAKIKLNSWSKV